MPARRVPPTAGRTQLQEGPRTNRGIENFKIKDLLRCRVPDPSVPARDAKLQRQSVRSADVEYSVTRSFVVFRSAGEPGTLAPTGFGVMLPSITFDNAASRSEIDLASLTEDACLV